MATTQRLFTDHSEPAGGVVDRLFIGQVQPALDRAIKEPEPDQGQNHETDEQPLSEQANDGGDQHDQKGAHLIALMADQPGHGQMLAGNPGQDQPYDSRKGADRGQSVKPIDDVQGERFLSV